MRNQCSWKLATVVTCLMLAFPVLGVAQNPVEFEISTAGFGDVFDLQVADVDGDNVTDIIFVGLVDTDLHIMYGMEGGGYEDAVAYSEGGRTLATAYVNQDNYLDIIVSGMYFVYVFINNGDRTFSLTTISQEYTNVGGVATGYFNDDAYLDIIAAYQHIHYGDGNGNFPSSLTLPTEFQTVYVGDFNNDNVDDFIALDRYGDSRIYINQLDGTFSSVGRFDLGALALSTSIKRPFADFNHDGNADFAFVATEISGVGPFTSTITVGYGDGTGDIIGFEHLYFLGTSYSLAIEDVNRDNNLDLVASNISYSKLELFLGDSEGGFSGSYEYEFDPNSVAKALGSGDLDMDGNPDFVAGGYWADGDASYNLFLFLNQSPDAPVLAGSMVTTGFANVGLDITNPSGFKLSKDYRTVAGADLWRQDIDNDNNIDVIATDFNRQYGEYAIIINPNPDVAEGEEFSVTINDGQLARTLFRDYKLTTTARALTDPFIFYYTVEENPSMQPANGSLAAFASPHFDWNGMVEHNPGVSRYQFELDRDYNFSAPLIVESNLESPEYSPITSLTEKGVYYWRFKSYDGVEWSDYSHTMAVDLVDFVCGDVDGTPGTDILDVVFLVNYKYKGGPAPEPLESGNIDGIMPVNILDIVKLINFLYKGGSSPACQ